VIPGGICYIIARPAAQVSGPDIRYLRNIAIIAHVDQGKTTLVDELLKQLGTVRENRGWWSPARWTATI